MNDLVRRTLGETIALHQRVMEGDLKPVVEAADTIARAIKNGGTLTW